MYKLMTIFIFILSSCNNNNVAVAETSPSKVIEAKRNSTSGAQTLSSVVKVKVEQVSEYKNIELRLIDIEDSRCPIGEQCIWAGQITVTLKVSNQATEKKEVRLIRKRESNIANAFGYNIRLLDVSPPPKKDKVIQLSEQTVTLEVVKS